MWSRCEVLEEHASMREADVRSAANMKHNREFSMGGANMSDDEQIIDDDDPGETITRSGESSPTSGDAPGSNFPLKRFYLQITTPQRTDVFRAFFSTLPSVLNDQNFSFIISL